MAVPRPGADPGLPDRPRHTSPPRCRALRDGPRRRPRSASGTALVDELVHTNAPGSRNRSAGRTSQDCWSRHRRDHDVNVQHIESLNGVVEQITGVVQRRRSGPVVARPTRSRSSTSRRSRCVTAVGGSGLPRRRIDAALSNYFRLGNLTALRELALLWLADEVDRLSSSTVLEHGRGHWQARERVVVAITGGPEARR